VRDARCGVTMLMLLRGWSLGSLATAAGVDAAAIEVLNPQLLASRVLRNPRRWAVVVASSPAAGAGSRAERNLVKARSMEPALDRYVGRQGEAWPTSHTVAACQRRNWSGSMACNTMTSRAPPACCWCPPRRSVVHHPQESRSLRSPPICKRLRDFGACSIAWWPETARQPWPKRSAARSMNCGAGTCLTRSRGCKRHGR